MGRLERIDPWSAEYEEELELHRSTAQASGIAMIAVAIAVVVAVLITAGAAWFVFHESLPDRETGCEPTLARC